MEGGLLVVNNLAASMLQSKVSKRLLSIYFGMGIIGCPREHCVCQGLKGSGTDPGKVASMRLQQARGGHRDSRKVTRWAGPLSNIFWAALVGKKITLTIILSSPKVDILHSSDISAPCITVYIIWIIQCMVIIWVCLVHVASFLGRTEEK